MYDFLRLIEEERIKRINYDRNYILVVEINVFYQKKPVRNIIYFNNIQNAYKYIYKHYDNIVSYSLFKIDNIVSEVGVLDDNLL